MSRLSDRINECRKDMGISQLELSKRIKKHQTYVSKVEDGSFVPPIHVLNQIAAELDIPVRELAALIPRTTRGYALIAEDFGFRTEHGDISLEEMHLIEAWRKLPADIRTFLRKAIGDANDSRKTKEESDEA